MDSPYLARIDAATTDLLVGLEGMDDNAAAAPSLLPGWDRAMLLTHLANHAEGVRRAVAAAIRGEVGEVYPGGRPARDAAIEAGRGSRAGELRGKLDQCARELAAALAGAPDEVWRRRALGPAGEVEIGPALVVGRLREVLVHHVDLQIGFGPQDWPVGWLMEEMDRILLDLPRRLPEGVAVVLEATDLGQHWVAGSGDEADITGTMPQLFAWLTGRSPGVPGQDCPPLGPWR